MAPTDRKASALPYSCGLLSAYPPTRSGLASFTAGLLHSLIQPGSDDRGGVVRVVDTDGLLEVPDVVAQLCTASADGPRAAAEALNQFDVALVQHDDGVFGGPDGDQILAVLDALRVPVVLVLHSVPVRPTPQQRQVLEQAISAADVVVTLTEAARRGLSVGYVVDLSKIVVIPPGAPDRGRWVGPSDGPPVILTWGLLGPGKGIEWAIGGLRHVKDLRPAPRYIIAGETHPWVRRRQGEAYRLGLVNRARALRVAEMVRFQPGYLDAAALNRLVHRADVVLLPNDSNDSAASSVLVEAIAAGKPVLAAAFPHAVELLGAGAGLLVAQGNSAAIGEGLHRVLTEPGLADGLAEQAAELAPTLLWSAIADRYRAVIHTLLEKTTVGLSGGRPLT
jgi:glycosyltransferase involved in cell wall biosynthesis